MIKVYTASKLSYAGEFRGYRAGWRQDGIDLHARWLDHAEIELSGPPVSPADFHIFWLVDEEDVKIADAVIVYGKKQDKLRGALVEAGMGIAAGKLVIVVGDCDDFGSWQHHPLVTRADSLEHAKTMILRRFQGAVYRKGVD